MVRRNEHTNTKNTATIESSSSPVRSSMSYSTKITNDLTEDLWNNWKELEPRSQPKNMSLSDQQRCYSFTGEHLPQILNNNRPIFQQNTLYDAFPSKGDIDVSSQCTVKKETEYCEDSNDQDESKYNPNMLLKIELSTPEASSTVDRTLDHSPLDIRTTDDLQFDEMAFNPYGANDSRLQNPTNPEQLKCRICDKQCPDDDSLLYHVRSHGRRIQSRRCDYCDEISLSKGKWNAHFKTHFSDPSFDCSFCNNSFVTQKYLNEHLKVHGADSILVTDRVNLTLDRCNDRTYPCTFCGKQFSDRPTILFHLRIHTSDTTFPCAYCGKVFLNKSEVNLHTRVHTGEKKHACKLCNKTFLTTSNLKQHFRIHTGDRPFSCKECLKTFSNKSNLMQHMKVHTGEKPYKCMHCDKFFTTTSNMRQHLRTHTGTKPYVCNFCGKTFISNSNLSQHKKVHRSIEEKMEENAEETCEVKS